MYRIYSDPLKTYSFPVRRTVIASNPLLKFSGKFPHSLWSSSLGKPGSTLKSAILSDYFTYLFSLVAQVTPFGGWTTESNSMRTEEIARGQFCLRLCLQTECTGHLFYFILFYYKSYLQYYILHTVTHQLILHYFHTTSIIILTLLHFCVTTLQHCYSSTLLHYWTGKGQFEETQHDLMSQQMFYYCPPTKEKSTFLQRVRK